MYKAAFRELLPRHAATPYGALVARPEPTIPRGSSPRQIRNTLSPGRTLWLTPQLQFHASRFPACTLVAAFGGPAPDPRDGFHVKSQVFMRASWLNAVVGDQRRRVAVAGRDAGWGDGLLAGDAGGDVQVQ